LATDPAAILRTGPHTLAVNSPAVSVAPARNGWVPNPTPRAHCCTPQTVHVVGVEVRQDNGIHDLHAESVEAAVDEVGVRPDIDDDGAVRSRPHDDPVALPHVTDHEPPARVRPGHRASRCEQGDADDTEHDRGQRVCEGCREHGSPDEQDKDRHDGQEDGSPRTVGPRDRRARHDGQRSRDAHDPERRQARHPREPPGQGRRHERHTRARHPADRRDRHERRRKQIGHHGNHRHRPLQQHDDRPTHDLRRERHRDGRSEQTRSTRQATSDRLAPRPGKDEQPQRRQGRQHESIRPSQPRIPRQDSENRAA
jgi:hypothetical protein